jgi:hypothetical protein
LPFRTFTKTRTSPAACNHFECPRHHPAKAYHFLAAWAGSTGILGRSQAVTNPDIHHQGAQDGGQNGQRHSAFCPGTNRAAFHALFAAVYNAAFEIGSPLNKKNAEPIPPTFKSTVLKISDTIRAGKAPQTVMEALARRTTHKDSRKTVFEYIDSKISRA